MKRKLGWRKRSEKSNHIEYKEYHLSGQELAICILQGLCIICIIAWIFYESIYAVILLSPIIPFYIKFCKKDKCRKRKWELKVQFKEGVQAVVSALCAGYSIENAFLQAVEDLKYLYNEDSLIIKEFKNISFQIHLSIPVELALAEFATRSESDDIRSLSDVFSTAKETGGDLIKIMRSTGRIIGDKIEVSREIETMMTAKKFEAKLMSVIPLGIILYLKVSSPGFLDPLFHNVLGVIIMTATLVVYILAFYLIYKIMDIEI